MMASEAVKKILEAESESNRKISEARQKSEEIVRDAQGGASLLIQKRISEYGCFKVSLGICR